MKTKTLKSLIKIQVPFVESFEDYHDIKWRHEELAGQGFKIKWKEIAFDGTYWGVFYEKKLPDNKTLKAMLMERGFYPDHEFSDFRNRFTSSAEMV